MHEFTSISVSSYDAASLADRLTEKSAEGWSVVSIVSAGTNVTAYLQRPAAGAAAVAPAEEVEETTEAAEVAMADDVAEAEPAEPAESTEAPAEAAAAAMVAAQPEPVVSEPAVSEPAGWGTAPETSHPTPEPAVSSGATDAVVTPEPAAAEPSIPSFSYGSSTTPEPAATPEPEPQPVVEPTVAFTPVQEQAAQPAQAEPVQQQAAAAVAPAGWYADPSGRYELRYWDGSQWTEHVSRAGQQFTDPPVA